MGVRAVSQCDVDICYGCVSKLLVCRHLALTCAWAFGSGSQAADAASLGSVAWKSACYGHVERKQGKFSDSRLSSTKIQNKTLFPSGPLSLGIFFIDCP